MAQNLLIVESPSKAKTIARFLNKNFTVKSCFGHIRDLKKKNMGIDINAQFMPHYEIPEDKFAVVKELKRDSEKCDEVWLATDEDREGEAISWHLCEVLGLNPEKTKRIVFHEITKNAILHAIENPRVVNMDLVYAQQARRVLDRIVGFQLSPLLKRKISMGTSLSAGRVQSVALRLIVEREDEIAAFKAEVSYKIKGSFLTAKGAKIANADGGSVSDEKGARAFLESCKGATYSVKDIVVKPKKKSPPAPFTTSTLQQEAARKLGFSVSRTMSVAQKLYENGHITYMRTDSVNLSSSALTSIAEHITKSYGENYAQRRAYKTKSASAQEAHEAIRPTNISASEIHDHEGQRLYKLIWQRTIASQMADARLETTSVDIEISTNKKLLQARGDVVVFDGYMKVYMDSKDEDTAKEDEDNNLLPTLAVGEVLTLNNLSAAEKHTRHKPRYGEAALVKKMEELGIGRPSTYAATISTIVKRTYVEKRDTEGAPAKYTCLTLDKKDEIHVQQNTEIHGVEKAKLHPTDLGKIVTRYLMQHFSKVMDYHFTASIEEDFDEVANGKNNWVQVVDTFYQPFIKNVHEHLSRSTDRVDTTRLLGTDGGKNVYARLGKFGALVQIGESDSEEKPKYVSIPAHLSIDTITLAQALALFTLPRVVGTIGGEEVQLNTGRYGPYASYQGKFYSLGRNVNPYEITDEKVLRMVEDKSRLPRNLGAHEGKEIMVNIGRFGPYATWGEESFSLKKLDPYEVTHEEAVSILKAHLESVEKRTLKTFPELGAVVLANRRFGTLVKVGGKNLRLTPALAQKKPEDLTDADIREIIAQQTGVKKTASNTKTKSVTKKTASSKKTSGRAKG